MTAKDILGIAIAGDDVVSVRKTAVHFFDIVFIKDIIRIENEESVKMPSWVIFGNMVKKRFQRIAFPYTPKVR